MDKCHAKDCSNQVSDPDNSVCNSCVSELNRLLVAELSARLGRPATDDDVERCLANIEAKRPKP